MPSFCAAINCTNRDVNPKSKDANLKEKSFHRIPKEKKMRIKWIKALRRANIDINDDAKIDQLRICSDHFKITDYKTNSENKRCLINNTVPSLFNFKRRPKPKYKSKKNGKFIKSRRNYKMLAKKNFLDNLNVSDEEDTLSLSNCNPNVRMVLLDHNYAYPSNLKDIKARFESMRKLQDANIEEITKLKKIVSEQEKQIDDLNEKVQKYYNPYPFFKKKKSKRNSGY